MIKSLNLDSNFKPTSYTEIGFETRLFTDGAVHFQLNNEENYSEIDKVIITNRFNSTDDLMRVLSAKDALRWKGIRRFELFMPYIPYARQDRVCNEGEAFTLKVFTTLLNTAGFERVYVLDPHSYVASALIDNCVILPIYEYIQLVAYNLNVEDLVLISPDSGANKKSNDIYNKVKIFSDIVTCDKERDLQTQEIKGFKVFTDDLKGKPCIIVDDICDGGRTFMGIAKDLQKKNAGDLYLFVTHAIFSYGTEELKKHFKKIFCTNSFRDVDDPDVHQFKLKF